MTDHSGLLGNYRRMREVRFRLSNRLVTTIPKKTLEECGRILGFSRNGVLFFESEDETSLLMDYCIYYPQSDGRNLVAKYLEDSPPPPGSDEMTALQQMTHAYYSLFQIVAVERGIGISVQDLLRDEPGFLADVSLGNTVKRQMMLATRIIPWEGFLATGGAAMPVNASAAERISREMQRNGYDPETFDFKQIAPRQEAELAAIIIRECRSTGMTSRIGYADPGSSARALPSDTGSRRHKGRCPCGSGKKYSACCGRQRS